MTRDEAKQLLPVIQAFAEGKTVEHKYGANSSWEARNEYRFDATPDKYRVKPESTQVIAAEDLEVGDMVTSDGRRFDPYAELKAAHDGGKTIQIMIDPEEWVDCDPSPLFLNPPSFYRVKPDEPEEWVERFVACGDIFAGKRGYLNTRSGDWIQERFGNLPGDEYYEAVSDISRGDAVEVCEAKKQIRPKKVVELPAVSPEVSDGNFDPVNRPKHYVSHESGKECIDYAEHMSFALGNCLKYIWRRDSKDNMVQNLRKGLWYLDREIKSRKVPNSLCLPPDIGLVLDHEPEPFRSIIDLIYENDGVPGWGRIEEARDMLADEISRLDKEAEANKPVPTVHHDGVVTVSVKIPESFSLCWDDRKPEVTEHPDEFTEDEEGEMPMSVNEVEDYILGLLKEAPRDMRWLRKWVCDAAGVAPNLYNSVIRWLHHSGSIESYDDHWQYVGSTPPVSETIGDKQVSVKDVEDEIIGLLVEAPRRIGWVGHWLTTHRFIDPDLVVKAMVDLRGRGHLVDDCNFLYYNWHGVK